MFKKLLFILFLWLIASTAYSFFYLYPQAKTIIKFFKTHKRFQDLSSARKNCPAYTGTSRSECFLEFMSKQNLLLEGDSTIASIMLHFNFFVVSLKESKELKDKGEKYKHKLIVVRAAINTLNGLRLVDGRHPASQNNDGSSLRERFYKKLRSDYLKRIKKLQTDIQNESDLNSEEKIELSNESFKLQTQIENVSESPF